MVVGGGQDVESCILQCLEVLVGGAELRIASVGLAAQRDLEVADGDVGTADVVLHQREVVAVVVCAVGTVGGIDLCLVLHEVAHEQQRHLLPLPIYAYG